VYKGPSLDDIPRAKVDPVEFPAINRDPAGKRFIENRNVALAALSSVKGDARDALMKGLAGKGDGGVGRDGGKDSGKDKGIGSGEGDGQGKPLTKRQKRILRWVMMFDTRDGYEYARYLNGLGAIIGVPVAQGKYRIIRNLLERPVRGDVEELEKIELMWWVDDKPESVRSLAFALQLDPVPNHLIAFFPDELERKLLDLELKYRGRREEDIQETQFHILKRRATRGGRQVDEYVPRVVGQTPLQR
jgi:hypothetical protein